MNSAAAATNPTMTFVHGYADMSRHNATIRGFSLVELMVAMTLESHPARWRLSVLYSSKVTYNENERVGRLQESGRAAVEADAA